MPDVKLIDAIREEGQPLDLYVLKDSVIGLLDDVLRGGEVTDAEKLSKIARLRARIVIEFRDL